MDCFELQRICDVQGIVRDFGIVEKGKEEKLGRIGKQEGGFFGILRVEMMGLVVMKQRSGNMMKRVGGGSGVKLQLCSIYCLYSIFIL